METTGIVMRGVLIVGVGVEMIVEGVAVVNLAGCFRMRRCGF